MAREQSWEEVFRLATARVGVVIDRIRALGLEVALHKTEAIWFAGVPPVIAAGEGGPRQGQVPD
jgi:hypothetical protein